MKTKHIIYSVLFTTSLLFTSCTDLNENIYSSIPMDHAIVRAGLSLGRTAYGSPTTSDQALLDCPSLKMGPGHSARSHSADEFIYLHEIEEGIAQYIRMLESVVAH